jgi:hypothetical protein
MLCRLCLSISIGFLVCINTAHSQLEDITLLGKDLFGPVKEVKTLSYDVSESENGVQKLAVSKRRNAAFNELVQYNPAGQKSLAVHYRQDAKIVQTTAYHYNDKGHLIRKSKYSPDSTSFAEILYKIDDNGNILHAKAGELRQALVTERRYTYDKYNNLISYVRFRKSSENGMTTRYIFNDQQQNTEIHYFDQSGNITNKNIFKYDQFGNQIEKNRFNTKRNAGSKIEYFYDSKGNKIESKHYSYSGGLIYQLKFTYDSKGNLLSKSQIQPDESVLRTERNQYEYDDRGNWILKTEYVQSKAKYVVERQIKYY